MAKKVIITCAVTGSVHTPSMSPHLPVTPAEIAQAAIGAAEAGAAIVHLHAREPETGKPTQDPAVYAKFLPRIAQECPAVINITTGGAITMTCPRQSTRWRRFSACVSHQRSIDAPSMRSITK